MLVHHRRDLVAGQPARRRRAGKPEAGQGEHHDAEGIGGCRALCKRIGEQRQQLPILEEQAGPAMSQQQRRRIWPGAGRAHYMHRDSVYPDAHVSELTETGCESQRVEGLPVGTQNHRPPHPRPAPATGQDFET